MNLDADLSFPRCRDAVFETTVAVSGYRIVTCQR